MGVDKGNGQSGKMRVAGYCIDCFIPQQMVNAENRIDDIVSVKLPEVEARVDRVAADVDKCVLQINNSSQEIAISMKAFSEYLKQFSLLLDRMSTRKKRGDAR
jgi:hypothetical protein